VHDRAENDPKNAALIHCTGFLGEYAFAKMMGLFPDFSINNNVSDPDFVTPSGLKVDIKATTKDSEVVWVSETKHKYDYDVYVFLRIQGSTVFALGWQHGKYITLPEYKKYIKKNDHYAYMYPRELLKPLETLLRDTEAATVDDVINTFTF